MDFGIYFVRFYLSVHPLAYFTSNTEYVEFVAMRLDVAMWDSSDNDDPGSLHITFWVVLGPD